MLNQRNYGIYEGRLAQDPVFFATAGGGENVILKVGCRRNFTSAGAAEPESDFAAFRGYIPKTTANHGVYGFLHTGDLVSIRFCLSPGWRNQGRPPGQGRTLCVKKCRDCRFP